MNKKKILLSTTIASAMFITGMTIPGVMAADTATDIYKARFSTNYLGNARNSISIELNNGVNRLKRKEVINLVEKKYSTGIVKSISMNGVEVTDDDSPVGTGATVTLNSGKTFTIVLYGDVTGDGIINNRDVSLALFDIINSERIPTTEARLAADVVHMEGEPADTININNRDVSQILAYYLNTDKGIEFEGNLVNEDIKLPNDNVTPITVNDKNVDVAPVADPTNAGEVANSGAVLGTTVEADPANGGATIVVGVEASELQAYERESKAKASADAKKWLKLVVDTGLNSWSIKDNSNVEAIENEPKKATLWIDAAQTENSVFKFENGEDPDEVFSITVKVVDIKDVNLKNVVKPEVAESDDENYKHNMSLVENYPEDTDEEKLQETYEFGGYYKKYGDDSEKSIKVPADVSKMISYKHNDKTGRWIKLLLETDMPSEQVASISHDIEAVPGSNKVIVWVDAEISDTNILLRSKYDKRGITADTDKKYKLHIENKSSLKVKDVVMAAIPVPADTVLPEGIENNEENRKLYSDARNQEKITPISQHGNVIEVEANDATVFERTIDDKKVNGRWYALLIDIGVTKNSVVGDDLVWATESECSEAGVTPGQTLLVWIDADEAEKEIKLLGKISSKDEIQEQITIKVNNINKTHPGKNITEKIGEVTYAVNSDESATDVNMNAYTVIDGSAASDDIVNGDGDIVKVQRDITLKARTNAMKKVSHNGKEAKWMTILVDTNVPRNDLVMIERDDEGKIVSATPVEDISKNYQRVNDNLELEEVRNGEILLWVNADADPNSKENTYEIANKHLINYFDEAKTQIDSSARTKTSVISFKVEEANALRLGENFFQSLCLDPINESDTDDEKAEKKAFDGVLSTVVGANNVDAYKKNFDCITVQETADQESGNIIVNANKSMMKSYKKANKEGKWYGILVPTNIVRDKLIADSSATDYIVDVANSKDLGATDYEVPVSDAADAQKVPLSEVLVWVKAENPTTIVKLKTQPDATTGIQETLEFTVQVKDTSTPVISAVSAYKGDTENGSRVTKAEFGVAAKNPDNKDEVLAKNPDGSTVMIEKDGKEVEAVINKGAGYVYANVKEMLEYTRPGSEAGSAKWAGIVLTLSTPKEDVLAETTDDYEVQTDVNGLEDNQILVWVKANEVASATKTRTATGATVWCNENVVTNIKLHNKNDESKTNEADFSAYIVDTSKVKLGNNMGIATATESPDITPASKINQRYIKSVKLGTDGHIKVEANVKAIKENKYQNVNNPKYGIIVDLGIDRSLVGSGTDKNGYNVGDKSDSEKWKAGNEQLDAEQLLLWLDANKEETTLSLSNINSKENTTIVVDLIDVGDFEV